MASKPGLFAQVALPAAIAVAAGVVHHLATEGALAAFLPPAAATKPYSDFDTFYSQRYLPEHSQEGTKALHLVGTTCMALLMAATPSLALALGAGMAAGMAAAPLTRHQTHGVAEMAVMMAVYLFVGARLTGSWRRAAAVPLVSYACAWVGHFFVEHNRPATFVYPTYSLMGDLRMVAAVIAAGTLRI
jgi:hypothetical protein